jgi:hypothetical protein
MDRRLLMPPSRPLEEADALDLCSALQVFARSLDVQRKVFVRPMAIGQKKQSRFEIA